MRSERGRCQDTAFSPGILLDITGLGQQLEAERPESHEVKVVSSFFFFFASSFSLAGTYVSRSRKDGQDSIMALLLGPSPSFAAPPVPSVLGRFGCRVYLDVRELSVQDSVCSNSISRAPYGIAQFLA